MKKFAFWALVMLGIGFYFSQRRERASAPPTESDSSPALAAENPAELPKTHRTQEPVAEVISHPAPPTPPHLPLTRAEFEKKFANMDFQRVLAHAKPFVTYHGHVPGTEAGILKAPDGKEMPFRLQLGSNNDSLAAGSCVSVQKPDKSIVIGRAGEGSLKVSEIRVKGAYALVLTVHDSNFFLVYPDPRRTGSDPNALLYFARQDDGKIVFQGVKTRTGTVDFADFIGNMDAFCPYYP